MRYHLRSARREGMGLYAGTDKFDIERALATGLAHQLIYALAGDDAVAIGIGIRAAIRARRVATDTYAEPDRRGCAPGPRTRCNWRPANR